MAGSMVIVEPYGEKYCRVEGYVKTIIEALLDKNDDQQRELFIILQQMDIHEDLEGFLFNHCVTVWEKIK